MKRMVLLVLVMLVYLAASGENAATPSEAVSAYDRIEMSMTKDEIAHLFDGVYDQDGEYIVFGGEVMCVFFESGRLQAKAKVFEDARDIAPVCAIPVKELSSYKQGMLISEVAEAFGSEGIEIMKINLADEDNAGVRRVFVWKTETNDCVQALFELDDNMWKLFAIAEVK